MNNLIPENITTKADLFKYLKENKSFIERQKKLATKEADAICYVLPFESKTDLATKEVGVINDNPTKLFLKVVINTTNILDSHGDVHIPKLWNKSLKENKNILFLQEHQMKFEKVISDNVNAYAKSLTWNAIGYNYEGKTEALIFETEIDIERNAFMFEQYKKGYVRNHSVGMQYVKLFLCINSNDKYFIDEKENWDKYINDVVNKDIAIEQGYFWAVTEAKVIEGSSVLIGSNQATPTISVTESKEADIITSTKIEPSIDTQKQKTAFSMMQNIINIQKQKI